MIRAKTTIFEKLAIAIMPKRANNQRTKRTEAISRKGLGSALIKYIIIKKINKSQRSIAVPLKLKSGIVKAVIGAYPNKRKIIRRTNKTVNIFVLTCYFIIQ